jgi:hypothetical protein
MWSSKVKHIVKESLALYQKVKMIIAEIKSGSSSPKGGPSYLERGLVNLSFIHM